MPMSLICILVHSCPRRHHLRQWLLQCREGLRLVPIFRKGLRSPVLRRLDQRSSRDYWPRRGLLRRLTGSLLGRQ